MTEEKSLIVAEEIPEGEIVSAEDMLTHFGLVGRGTVEGIANNLAEHSRGKVAGGYVSVTEVQLKKARSQGNIPPEWRKSYDVDGNEVVVRPGRKVGQKMEQGDLLMPDAIRVTQKTLSRGLNPLAHISIWYQGGQLIDNVNYTIMKGMAEQQGSSSIEFADMTADEITSHKLQPKDIGKVAYLVMDTDKSLLLQATMQFSAELGFREAKRQALEMIKKAKGIGIVRKDEGLYVLKGRSLDWLAEKRASTDAIRRAFGEMTPAQIAHYASGEGFVQQQDLKALASPDYQAVAHLPSEDQQVYLQTAQITKDIKETPPADLAQSARQNVEAMRGNNGDDDPVEGQTELPKAMHPSALFWQYSNANNTDRTFAGQFIAQANGDFDKALELLKAAQAK